MGDFIRSGDERRSLGLVTAADISHRCHVNKLSMKFMAEMQILQLDY
jgi:hypothetical protein